MPSPFKSATLYDSLGAFSGGTNEGTSPLDLPPNTMAAAINTTVRGKFVTHRSAYWKRPIAYPDSATQSAVEGGVYQGGCFGTDDAGNASLVAFISERLFQFLIQGNTPRCQEIIIPGGPILPIQPQAWLWQSERWIIIQDGKNNPLFLDLDGGVTPVYGNGLVYFSGGYAAGGGALFRGRCLGRHHTTPVFR